MTATGAGTLVATDAASYNLDAVLATIRQLESGNYSQPPNAGGASGAYQYINSTWRSEATAAGYGQYANEPAYLAPPAVQDAVAANNVKGILGTYGGNVAYVPLIWYYPAAASNPGLLDVVPYPGAGNVLTPRQYQSRWLSVYNKIAGGGATAPATTDAGATSGATAQTAGIHIPGTPFTIPTPGDIAKGAANAAGDVAKSVVASVLSIALTAVFVVAGLGLAILGLARLFNTTGASGRLAQVLPLAVAAAA